MGAFDQALLPIYSSFGWDVRDAPALSHHADPPTSAHAAEAIAASGVLNAQCVETLQALATCVEPVTSHELAGADLCLRYRYARRLPDLRTRGLVVNGPERICRVSGRVAVTWRLTEAGRERA